MEYPPTGGKSSKNGRWQMVEEGDIPDVRVRYPATPNLTQYSPKGETTKCYTYSLIVE